MNHKRTDIQALRALAVIAVVLYHLWPNHLPGGFMGVDIFFVISGYLMTSTLLKDVNLVVRSKQKLSATFSYLANFYARRIKRLIPAAAVTLLAVLGLVWATGQYNIIEQTAQQVIASGAFVQNWELARESVDYLASSQPPTAVQHFWSLSLEEQFYLVWPLLLVVISLITLNLYIVYKKTRISGSIIPVIILAIGFFTYGWWLTKYDAAQAYFFTPARVWELVIGGAVALLPMIKNYDFKLLLPWLGTAMNLYAIFLLNGDNFPGWHALIPTIGTALVLYGGTTEAESKWSFDRLLKWRWIQGIGNISYSLYLWHWPMIILLPVLIGFNIDDPSHGKWFKLGIMVLSIILAWLSYRFVETPFLRIKPRKWIIYGLLIATIAIVSTSGYLVYRQAESSAKNGLADLHKIALNNNQCFGANAINDHSCPPAFGSRNNVWAQFAGDDKFWAIIGQNNHLCPGYDHSPGQDDPSIICRIGSPNPNDPVVIIWGDSHAEQWENAFDRIGLAHHIQFVVFANSGAASVQGCTRSTYITQLICQDRTNFITNSPYTKAAKTIIVSVFNNSATDESDNTVGSLKYLDKEFPDKQIFLLEDTPLPGKSGGPNCYKTALSCTNSLDDATSTTNAVDSAVVQQNLLNPAHLIKITDLFCDQSQCYSFIGGVSVYYNNDLNEKTGNGHLTGSYSVSLAEPLYQKLKQAGAI